MCRSQAEGGQRCAAHTRDPYNNTPPTDPTWDTRAAEYASTPEGERVITEQIAGFTQQGNQTAVGRLTSALQRGNSMREANRASGAAIGNARPPQVPPTDRTSLQPVIDEACSNHPDGWAVDPEDSNASINEAFYEAEHFHGREVALEHLRASWRHHRKHYIDETLHGGSIAARGRHAALMLEIEDFVARVTGQPNT